MILSPGPCNEDIGDNCVLIGHFVCFIESIAQRLVSGRSLRVWYGMAKVFIEVLLVRREQSRLVFDDEQIFDVRLFSSLGEVETTRDDRCQLLTDSSERLPARPFADDVLEIGLGPICFPVLTRAII